MENISRQKEEALKENLKHIREEQENIEYKVKSVLKEEENEEIEINRSYIGLNQMSERCTAEDKRIQRVIKEKQNMLNGLRKRKIEFKDAFLREMKKSGQKMEEEAEKIRQELTNTKNESDVRNERSNSNERNNRESYTNQEENCRISVKNTKY